MSNYISSVNLRDYYTIPHRLLDQESSRVGGGGYISLQRQRGRVSVGRSGSDVTGTSGGGGGGRNDSATSYWANSETGSAGGDCGSREYCYGSDAIMGSLRRVVARSKVSFEAENG